ncbi:COG1266 Predicted metal-dependent membrane protease [Flavobacteriaceae bacterium]
MRHLKDYNAKLLLKEKSPLVFFSLVFGLSIPFWIIDLEIDSKRSSSLNFSIVDIITTFIPLIVACTLIMKEEGKSGVYKLFKRIFDFERITKKSWYLPIIFLPLLIYFLIYSSIYLFGLPLANNLQIPYKSIPFLFVLFFIGAVCEESGYMGYAIEPMQKKFGALGASILIGIPWAVWHYPSIIQQGHNFYWIFWATLGTVAVRVLIVWIFNNTQNSLFACIMFHTMMNLGRPMFPKDEIHNPLVDYPYIHYSVIAIMAIIVIFLWGSKTLSKFKFILKKINS